VPTRFASLCVGAGNASDLINANATRLSAAPAELTADAFLRFLWYFTAFPAPSGRVRKHRPDGSVTCCPFPPP
jgi:hypothetical protein